MITKNTVHDWNDLPLTITLTDEPDDRIQYDIYVEIRRISDEFTYNVIASDGLPLEFFKDYLKVFHDSNFSIKTVYGVIE